MANETPSRPPPLMANAILNFHFDFLTPSLKCILETFKGIVSQSLLPKKPLKAKEASLQCAQVLQHHPAVCTT